MRLRLSQPSLAGVGWLGLSLAKNTYGLVGKGIENLTLIRLGGGGGEGEISPANFKMLIPRDPKVGLTSNQAVNSSLFIVSRSKKN